MWLKHPHPHPNPNPNPSILPLALSPHGDPRRHRPPPKLSAHTLTSFDYLSPSNPNSNHSGREAQTIMVTSVARCVARSRGVERKTERAKRKAERRAERRMERRMERRAERRMERSAERRVERRAERGAQPATARRCRAQESEQGHQKKDPSAARASQGTPLQPQVARHASVASHHA